MKSVFTLAISLLSIVAFCQEKVEVTLQSTDNLAANQKFVARDMYDDIYFIEGNAVKKKGRYSTSSYGQESLGMPTSVDIQNPMGILLFYKEAKSFVIVSKELAQLTRLDVSTKFPSMDLAYIGSSTKKDIWMMNGATASVTRYNMTTYERITVHKIKESEVKHYASTIHYFFWIDNTNLLKGIDINGKEILSYQLESDFDLIQIMGSDNLFYTYKDKMYYVDMLKSKQYEVALPDKSVESFFYNSQKLSIFADKKINNYTIKLP